jgi:hypothetical protein
LFTLLRDLIKHCPQGLFSLDASRFNNMILAINFSMKHSKSEICDLGLDAMNSLLKMIAYDEAVRDSFFQRYFCLIFDETMHIMT